MHQQLAFVWEHVSMQTLTCGIDQDAAPWAPFKAAVLLRHASNVYLFLKGEGLGWKKSGTKRELLAQSVTFHQDFEIS